MSGKGSSPRPFSVSKKTFDDNWNKIFNKEKNQNSTSEFETVSLTDPSFLEAEQKRQNEMKEYHRLNKS